MHGVPIASLARSSYSRHRSRIADEENDGDLAVSTGTRCPAPVHPSVPPSTRTNKIARRQTISFIFELSRLKKRPSGKVGTTRSEIGESDGRERPERVLVSGLAAGCSRGQYHTMPTPLPSPTCLSMLSAFSPSALLPSLDSVPGVSWTPLPETPL